MATGNVKWFNESTKVLVSSLQAMALRMCLCTFLQLQATAATAHWRKARQSNMK